MMQRASLSSGCLALFGSTNFEERHCSAEDAAIDNGAGLHIQSLCSVDRFCATLQSRLDGDLRYGHTACHSYWLAAT